MAGEEENQLMVLGMFSPQREESWAAVTIRQVSEYIEYNNVRLLQLLYGYNFWQSEMSDDLRKMPADISPRVFLFVGPSLGKPSFRPCLTSEPRSA
jgi:hypothetical protein